jgi:hypothetical protein
LSWLEGIDIIFPEEHPLRLFRVGERKNFTKSFFDSVHFVSFSYLQIPGKDYRGFFGFFIDFFGFLFEGKIPMCLIFSTTASKSQKLT